MLSYHSIDSVSAVAWLELLNSERVRKHFLQHPLFTAETPASWLKSKIAIDQTLGCRLQAVFSDGNFAGWCDIQRESGEYEITLVLSPDSRGHGRQVMRQVLKWARELGHRNLLAHLSRSRPQTQPLAKLLGEPIKTSTIQHTLFCTYCITL